MRRESTVGMAGGPYLHQRNQYRRELMSLVRELEELGAYESVRYGKEVLKEMADKVRG